MSYAQQCIFNTNTINDEMPSGIELRNRILAGLGSDPTSAEFRSAATKAYLGELAKGPCDLRTALNRTGLTVPPGINPSCLGAVVGSLSRKKVIVRTGELVPASQRQAHARGLSVWRLTEGGTL